MTPCDKNYLPQMSIVPSLSNSGVVQGADPLREFISLEMKRMPKKWNNPKCKPTHPQRKMIPLSIHKVMNSFNKYLWSTYLTPAAGLGSKQTSVNKIDKFHPRGRLRLTLHVPKDPPLCLATHSGTEDYFSGLQNPEKKIHFMI